MLNIKCLKHLLNCVKKSRISPPLKILKKQLIQRQKSGPCINYSDLRAWEIQIIKEINDKTIVYNLNNLTRTDAYLDFYKRHPEVYWSFIGHMVSRNGGWNMTDLKGEPLSNLLSKEEQDHIFQFLERGNWLIFQDVYPQLLLYEKSLLLRKNLFYLLPFFHVSLFMEVVWNYFWKHNDRYMLAIALVINEQSYLEMRVIQNDHFKKTVLQTLEFKLQDLLSLNYIVFPYRLSLGTTRTGIVGKSLHHFDSVHQRILLGKNLYKLLFADQKKHKQILLWATTHKHTGSREDYFPSLFHHIKEAVPGRYYSRTENCKLKNKAPKLYSPKLEYAWKNIRHKKAEKGDWFSNWKVIYLLRRDNEATNGDIFKEYCEALERIEFAAAAKSAILD